MLQIFVVVLILIDYLQSGLCPQPKFLFFIAEVCPLGTNKTSSEVAAKIRRLKAELPSAGVSFGDVFPLILTDK
jgi:hypothetical protein